MYWADMQFASMSPVTHPPIVSQRPFGGSGLQHCSLPAVHAITPSSRPAQQAWQHVPSRGRVIAAADASVKVKLGMAAERLTLDLSECDLLEVPPKTFDIPGLEVRGDKASVPRKDILRTHEIRAAWACASSARLAEMKDAGVQ